MLASAVLNPYGAMDSRFGNHIVSASYGVSSSAQLDLPRASIGTNTFSTRGISSGTRLAIITGGIEQRFTLGRLYVPGKVRSRKILSRAAAIFEVNSRIGITRTGDSLERRNPRNR